MFESLWWLTAVFVVLLPAGLVGVAGTGVGGAEAEDAGRLWSMSSGGGTGNTTGEALAGSLFTRRTSIGPEELFKWIWYFFCPFTTWNREELHDHENNKSLTRGVVLAPERFCFHTTLTDLFFLFYSCCEMFTLC